MESSYLGLIDERYWPVPNQDQSRKQDPLNQFMLIMFGTSRSHDGFRLAPAGAKSTIKFRLGWLVEKVQFVQNVPGGTSFLAGE